MSLPLNISQDGIVLEGKEVFSLQFQRLSGQLTADLIGTTVAIIDKDGKGLIQCQNHTKKY